MRSPVAPLLLILLSLWSAAVNAAVASKDSVLFSLHIGVNEAPPGSQLPRLRFADDDAWRMYRFFSAASVHSEWLALLDEQSRKRTAARLLEPPAPTKVELEKAIARLRLQMKKASHLGKKVKLVVTFAGHGVVQDGKVQLALLDGFLSQSFFDELASWVEVDRLHLILDACHAGGVFTGRGFRTQGSAERISSSSSTLIDRSWFIRRPHVGALLSSSASDVTHEWSRIEGGLFTHEVLSALRGAADINADQKVTYDEVAAFSALAKSTLMDPVSAGSVLSFPPTLAPFAALAELEHREEGRLEIPESRRLLIRHDDGRNVMHVFTGKSSTATVVLPMHTPLVAVNEKEEEAVFVLQNSQPYSFSLLTFYDVGGVRGNEAGAQKGWLRRPFTSDFFNGWSQSKPRESPQVVRVPGEERPMKEHEVKPSILASDKVNRPWMAIGGLTAFAVGCTALSVASGVWMAVSAQTYNATSYEVPAATAALDYSVATSGMLVFGATALVAVGAVGVLFLSPEIVLEED